MNIRPCSIFSWFNRFQRFVLSFRSVNVLVFDWLIRKYKTFSLVNSWCLTNNVKLACGLKSRSRNVIMKVQFSAAARRCPSSGLLILRAQIVHINESQGKLALFRTYNNILLTVLHNLFSLTLLLFFISTFPPPHRPNIDPRWTSLHLHFLLLVSIVFPPPALPPHFYCVPSSSPPPPPSHFYCFPSSSSFLFYPFLLIFFSQKAFAFGLILAISARVWPFWPRGVGGDKTIEMRRRRRRENNTKREGGK